MNWFRKLWPKTAQDKQDAKPAVTTPVAPAQSEPVAAPSAGAPRWLAAGDAHNPFAVDILDLMSNLSLTAMSKDPAVAARAVSWRAGQQGRIARTGGFVAHPCQLSYPAAAELPNGMLYCPDCMEDKWVFAWVDGEIRIARSWSGETQAIAPATLRDGVLHVERVLLDPSGPLATLGDPVTCFDWLMRTHPLGQRIPFSLSAAGARTLESGPLLGFSLFGRQLFCAAVDFPFPPASQLLCSDGDVVAAIQQRDAEALRRLLAAGASMTSPSTLGGYRPMHLALVVKSQAVLEVLLKHGADVNQRALRGTTPLQVGISVSCELALLDLLLAHGADLEAADEKGFRPLHEAVQVDSPETVRWLVEKGASVAARTANGLAPLHIACGLGSLRAAKALHAADADLRTTSPLGTPAEIAQKEGKTELHDWLRSVL